MVVRIKRKLEQLLGPAVMWDTTRGRAAACPARRRRPSVRSPAKSKKAPLRGTARPGPYIITSHASRVTHAPRCAETAEPATRPEAQRTAARHLGSRARAAAPRLRASTFEADGLTHSELANNSDGTMRMGP